MKKVTTVLLSALIICGLALAYSTRSGNAATMRSYPDITLTPPGGWGVMSTHYGDVWDLTKGDLTLSYKIDMSHVAQPAVWDTSWTEVGLRTEGASDFNPGPFGVYQGGCGGWMTSSYGDLTPSPNTLSLFDKHNLGASGGEGEGDYDCLVPGTVIAEFGSGNSYGIWFDRDGVDPWQATYWGAVNGGTYNTGGIYTIVINYHAINANLGTMFATVNGIQTGFYSNGWQNAPPDKYPAGLSFKGDMTRMQVFEGIMAPPPGGAAYGSTTIQNLLVVGTLGVSNPLTANFNYSPTIVGVGTTVQFTDATTGGYLPYSAWSWDFGDGGTSAAQNPSHVYTTPGDYNVKLTVTGSCPQCGSAAITKGIHVYAYEVSFTQTGISSDAGTNTVLTLGGTTTYAYNALPSNVWVDSGTTFSWSSPVAGATGERFAYVSDSGLSNPISGPGTDAAIYKTQYYLTVTSAYDTPTGAGWYDATTSAAFGINPTIIHVGTMNYVFAGWSGSGNGQYTGPAASSSIFMNGPITETAKWITSEPPSVGGEWAPITFQAVSPINAVQLLATWIALALIAAASAIAAYKRLFRKNW